MFQRCNYDSLEAKCHKAERRRRRVNGQWRSKKTGKKARKFRAACNASRAAWQWAMDRGWIPF